MQRRHPPTAQQQHKHHKQDQQLHRPANNLRAGACAVPNLLTLNARARAARTACTANDLGGGEW